MSTLATVDQSTIHVPEPHVTTPVTEPHVDQSTISPLHSPIPTIIVNAPPPVKTQAEIDAELDAEIAAANDSKLYNLDGTKKTFCQRNKKGCIIFGIFIVILALLIFLLCWFLIPRGTSGDSGSSSESTSSTEPITPSESTSTSNTSIPTTGMSTAEINSYEAMGYTMAYPDQ
jgi:hypothetical protein